MQALQRRRRQLVIVLMLAVAAAFSAAGATGNGGAPAPAAPSASGKGIAAPDPLASEPGLDTGRIIEQVRHNVGTVAPGHLRAEDRSYRADFTAAGFSLSLKDTTGAVDGPAALTIRSATIDTGAGAKAIAATPWRGTLNAAERHVAPGVLERVTARDDELEWDFVLNAAPRGDVTITAAVPGPAGVRAGKALRYGEGDRAVRVGQMIVIDAKGRELYRALPSATPGTMTLSVPAERFNGAAYPVTIDPTVGPERAAADSAAGPTQGWTPAVAAGATNSLIVWPGGGAAGQNDILATRVDSAGNVLDPVGISIASGPNDQRDPDVSWNGTHFVVVWRENVDVDTEAVAYARLTSTGTVVSPAVTYLSVASPVVRPRVASVGATSLAVWAEWTPFGQVANGRIITSSGTPGNTVSLPTNGRPDVTASTTQFLVAVDDPTGTPGVYARRFATDGSALGSTITVDTGTTSDVAVAFNGSVFAVAYRLGSTSPDIFGKRISTSGTVLDSTRVSIATESGGFGVAEYPTSMTAIPGGGSFYLAFYRAQSIGFGTQDSLRGTRLSSSTLAPLDGVGGVNIGDDLRSGDVAWNGSHFLVGYSGYSGVAVSRVNTSGAIVDTVRPTVGNPQYGTVASYDGTNFLLAWVEQKSFFSGTDEVKAARISPTGTLLDPAGISVTPSGEHTFDVALTWDGTNHIASWVNSSGVVRLARITPGGAVLDPTPQTVGTGADPYSRPATVSVGGVTMIAYSTGQVVKVRRFSGASFVEPAAVDSFVVPDSAGGVTLAHNGSVYLAAWHEFGGIRVNRLNAAGLSLDGSGQSIATGSSLANTNVASNGTDFLVTWQELLSGAFRVRFRRVLATGVPEGSAMTMNSSIRQSDPRVAWNGETYLLTWMDDRGPTSDVYAARITSAGSNLDGAGIPVSATDSYEYNGGLVRGVRGRIGVTYERYEVEGRHTEQSFMRTFDDVVNDDFVNARALTGANVVTDGINVGATEEPGEPNDGPRFGGKSVWFNWTAPAGGSVTADTFGSTFDTVLAIYTGNAVDALTPVASNDDAPGGGLQSQVTFPVRSGRTYRISIDGFNASLNPLNATEGQYKLSLAFTVDNVPPDTTIVTGPSGTTADTHATFTFSANEADSTFECSLDNAAWESCVSPTTYTGLVPGSHAFQVRATDPAGNVDPTPASRSWTINTTAPETTIVSGPSGTTASTSASFVFSSDDPAATFECQLNASGFSACTSPRTYTGLVSGSQTFSVRAKNAAGTVDASPASRTWTVDATAPDTTITSGPASTTNATSASFSFNANEAGSTFECKLDGGAFVACSSPQAYSSLTEGSHTFQVRAIDSVGNVDPTPAQQVWTIDTTAPDTTITGGPSGPVTTNTASFTFSSPDGGVTFACSLDAAPFTACSSPMAYNGLTDGAHSFAVRAVDAAGNADPTPASRSWTVDTAAPVTTITSAPSGNVSSTSANVSFTSSEPSSTHCSLDGGAFNPCTSPATFTGLSQGAHTVRVRSTDTAGNVEATPPSATWTVDTVAPDTTITSGPSGLTNSRNATIAFSATEGGSTFQCSLDGSPFGTCTSPVSYSSLADGAHTFAVRATDAAGNTDASAATSTWTVDATAPDTTITSAPSGTVTSRDATFTFTSTEPGSTFACSVDGSAFSACTSPFTRTDLGDGPHTFAVRATDAAGNTDATPAGASWTIDATAPDTSITGGPPSLTSSATVSFSFTATEGGSTFACRMDAGAFAPCTSPAQFTVADGAHTFAVRATDAVGNTDASPATMSFTVDTVAPETTINSGPSGTVASNGATFTFAASEAGSTFGCSLDGGPVTPCTSPASFTGLADGSHTFTVRATDAAGNTDATPASRTWTVDVTPPDTTIVLGPAAVTASNSATFTFASSESGSTFRCRLDGAAFAGCTSPHSLENLTEGTHTFEVIATDGAGNADPSPAQRVWRVDRTPPNTTITSGPSGTTSATSSSFVFTATETGSTFECRIDGGPFASCSSPQTVDGLSDGPHTFEVRASDEAGNTDASPASRTWTIDTRAPETTITGGPSGAIQSTSATFQFVSDETGSSFRCSMDGGTFTVCSSPSGYAGLSQGSHQFRVKAVDAAGNEDPTPATVTFTVDTTAPTVTITRPTPGLWVNDQRMLAGDQTTVFGAITIQATATDASGIASFVFEVDGTAVPSSQVSFDPGTNTYTFTYRPTTGMHTVVARATDAAGLTRTASVSMVAVSA